MFFIVDNFIGLVRLVGLVGLVGLNDVVADFLLPDGVAGEVPADAFVLVVGVHLACLLVDVSLLVVAAAAANVLTVATKPLGGGTDEVEDAIFAVVADCDNFFPASASGVGATVAVAILVEVFPTFAGVALSLFAHPLVYLSAFVVRFVAFHESAIAMVDAGPVGGDV